VESGDLFVALVGAKLDGHAYLSEVSSKQAVCAVVQRQPEIGFPAVVLVPDTRHALALLAAKFYDFPSRKLKVLGVTGTNGKTTVTYLIKTIFESRGRRTGLIGTIEYLAGNHRFVSTNTTPESLQLEQLLAIMYNERMRVAVMEVSSHALKAGRTRMIDFNVVGITNLSQDHLDFHKNMEDYKSTKAMIFDRVHGKEKWAVLNMDDPEFEYFKSHVDSSYLAYSIGNKQADILAADVKIGPGGSQFKLVTPLGEGDVSLALPGEHNVSNAICAASFAMAAGLDSGSVASGLSAASTVRGRLESVDNDRGIHIYVDYAHTPDALEHVCSVCKKLSDRNLVVVFGCGGDRDKTKRKPMGEAVSRYADTIIVTSDNPRSEDPSAIIEDIKPGLDPAVQTEIVVDRRSAIKTAIALCSEGDILLVAGKGHEDYQIIGNQRNHFDDREVICEVLGEGR
jgi:UDP-N-acetylmuramoyl-L-alanyl-D-glutamate--2,6-diaminopimelate ligase